MAGLAAFVSWSSGPQASATVGRMLDRLPHRGKARKLFATERVCLGTLHSDVATNNYALLGDSGSLLACVADLRLDNREEIGPLLLGRRQELPPDAQLLLLGYRCWGNGLANRLVGDFAFVIWEEGQQALYAARDPFGTRPLFYRRTPLSLALGSEAEQLLSFAVDLDPHVILDYLLGQHQVPGSTFFKGVSRLQPGHWLEARTGTFREKRYWLPPARSIRCTTARERDQNFQGLFREAVRARLDPDRPVVAQLSGGIDSSSVVCMAASIAAQHGKAIPVVAGSAVFPGLRCDESRFIKAVIRRTGVPWERWDGTRAPTIDAAGFCAGHPWAGTTPDTLEGDWHLARRLGAPGILSGTGGDELLFEAGVFRDLASRGEWLQLMHQAALAPLYSSRSALSFIRDAVRTVAPGALLRAYRMVRRPRAVSAPDWLGPALRSIYPDSASERPAPVLNRSYTRGSTWAWLTSPALWWAVELQTLRAARQGLELRFPFLDRRLAEFVLGLGCQDRLPSGRMKRLLRSAMGDLLPAEVARRRGVTTFDEVTALNFQKNRCVLRALFNETPWLCTPFADQAIIRKRFQALDRDSLSSVSYSTIVFLLDVAQLELWVRGLVKTGIALP